MPENYDDLFIENEQSNAQATPQSKELSKEEFAAKMKSERESLSTLANETAMSIGENSSAFQNYLNTLSKFERYSTHNTLLIHAQKPDATKLGSYESWLNAGTPVIKGESSISIYEPGKEYKRKDGTVGVSMNIKKVFDISQTSAKNKIQPETKHEIRTLLKAMINNSPVPVQLVDSLPDNMGAQYNGSVIEITRGLDGENLFRCMAQEMSYAILHQQDVETATNEDIGFAAYAASYVMCEKHGIDTEAYDFSESIDYFKDKESNEVISELKAIRDTVHDVAGRMAKELNPPQKDVREQEAR